MPSTVAARPAPRPAEEVDPRLLDAVLSAAMAVVVAVVAAADLEGTGRAGALAYLFAAGFGALLLARRHAPRLVLVLTVLGIFAYYAFQLPPIGIALPAVAALFSAAEADRTRSAVAAGTVLVSVAAEAVGRDDAAAARALEQIRSAASATLRELRELRIADDGRGAPPGTGPDPAGGGRGLQGMAERARLLGGTLTAGSRNSGERDGGGFEVRATLPRRLGP